MSQRLQEAGTIRGLFFDLDHSLIRPKSGKGVTTCLDDENIQGWLPKGKTATSITPVGNGHLRVEYANTFPKDADDWEFVPGVVEAIRPFMEQDFVFIIISNQGGIEAGHHTDLEIEEKLAKVLTELAAELNLPPIKGSQYSYGYRFCSSLREHPDRKPNPGMVLKAIEEYDIDPQWSYSVGDMNTDQQAFSAAGIRHYYHIDHFITSQPKPDFLLYQ